jgi:hypothetical protein
MKLMTMPKRLVDRLLQYLKDCRAARGSGAKKKIDYQSSAIKSIAVGCPPEYVAEGIRFFLASNPPPSNKDCAKRALFYKAYDWLVTTVIEQVFREQAAELSDLAPFHKISFAGRIGLTPAAFLHHSSMLLQFYDTHKTSKNTAALLPYFPGWLTQLVEKHIARQKRMSTITDADALDPPSSVPSGTTLASRSMSEIGFKHPSNLIPSSRVFTIHADIFDIEATPIACDTAFVHMDEPPIPEGKTNVASLSGKVIHHVATFAKHLKRWIVVCSLAQVGDVTTALAAIPVSRFAIRTFVVCCHAVYVWKGEGC